MLPGSYIELLWSQNDMFFCIYSEVGYKVGHKMMCFSCIYSEVDCIYSEVGHKTICFLHSEVGCIYSEVGHKMICFFLHIFWSSESGLYCIFTDEIECDIVCECINILSV